MTAQTATIRGFIETSFVDWPGKMASVIFLGRCNWRCPYCHNSRLVTDPDQYATRPLEEVLERLETLRGWVDGVCVTGGEPTVSPGLPDLLVALKANNWPVKLDTNGSNPEILADLIIAKLVDGVSLDVKAPLEPIPYRRNTGVGADPEKIRQTLLFLARAGLPFELRTTVHPSLLTLAELKRLAATLVEIFGPGVALKLQNCRVGEVLTPTLLTAPPLDQQEFQEWVEEVNAVLDHGTPNRALTQTPPNA